MPEPGLQFPVAPSLPTDHADGLQPVVPPSGVKVVGSRCHVPGVRGSGGSHESLDRVGPYSLARRPLAWIIWLIDSFFFHLLGGHW